MSRESQLILYVFDVKLIFFQPKFSLAFRIFTIEFTLYLYFFLSCSCSGITSHHIKKHFQIFNENFKLKFYSLTTIIFHFKLFYDILSCINTCSGRAVARMVCTEFYKDYKEKFVGICLCNRTYISFVKSSFISYSCIDSTKIV